MHSEFSEETQHRITGLCSKISVANHLNDEIREELHGHIADKMEAYLDGSEVITEDDAFVLVREHFGNPEVIRSMYEVAEPVAATENMLKRFAAAIITSVLLFSLGSYVFQLFLSALIKMTSYYGISDVIVFGIPALTTHLLFVLVFALILAHWKNQMTHGEQPWFLRIKPYILIGLIIFSTIMLWAIQNMTQRLIPQSSSFSNYTHAAAIFIQCIILIWWMDNNSKRFLNIFMGFLAWMISQHIYFNATTILQNLYIFRQDITFKHFMFFLDDITGFALRFIVMGILSVTIYLLMIGVQSARKKIINSFAQ